jgi:hypothetical protein
MKQFNFAISKWQDSPDREDPVTLVSEITPEQAGIMLRNNANRAIKINQVNKFRRDIRAGNFKITNDAIAFSKEGAVLNGQHRLLAIFQEGKPVKADLLKNNKRLWIVGKSVLSSMWLHWQELAFQEMAQASPVLCAAKQWSEM